MKGSRARGCAVETRLGLRLWRRRSRLLFGGFARCKRNGRQADGFTHSPDEFSPIPLICIADVGEELGTANGEITSGDLRVFSRALARRHGMLEDLARNYGCVV